MPSRSPGDGYLYRCSKSLLLNAGDRLYTDLGSITPETVKLFSDLDPFEKLKSPEIVSLFLPSKDRVFDVDFKGICSKGEDNVAYIHHGNSNHQYLWLISPVRDGNGEKGISFSATFTHLLT